MQGDSVPCCKTKIGDEIIFIQGTKAELEETLLPRDCPPARQMGYTLKATHGTYVRER